MMKRLFPMFVLCALLAGCRKDAPIASDPPEVPKEADSELAEGGGASYWNKVNELYEQARESGQTTAASAHEWMTDLYGDAKEMTFGSAAEANAWAKEMYEQAKRNGETTAASASEWVKADLKKNGAWEYKTVSIPLNQPGQVEAELNQLGHDRWECFWVDKQEDVATFYLKKSTRSLLRQMPARDVLRLLPLLGGGGGDDAGDSQ